MPDDAPVMRTTLSVQKDNGLKVPEGRNLYSTRGNNPKQLRLSGYAGSGERTEEGYWSYKYFAPNERSQNPEP